MQPFLRLAAQVSGYLIWRAGYKERRMQGLVSSARHLSVTGPPAQPKEGRWVGS